MVWLEINIGQGACAYPITPSTNMGSGYQTAVANGQPNLWGEPLAFLELESEHSSASTRTYEGTDNVHTLVLKKHITGINAFASLIDSYVGRHHSS